MRTIVLLTVCSFGAGIAPAATIYSDSTFNPSDWTVVTQSSTGDASMTFAQAAGGNPGPSRTMTYTTSGQTGSSSVRLASINPLFIYDPGVSGAIAGLSFQYEISFLNAVSIGGANAGGYRPALRQGGVIYTMLNVNHTTTSNTWTSFSIDGLDPAFPWVDINTPASSPDFSASGGLIEFGYRVAYGTTCSSPTGCAGGSVTSALDNYRVTITPQDDSVPEPSTWALFAAGAVLFTLRRRG